MRSLGVQVTLRYLGNLRSTSAICRASREVNKESKSYDIVHAQFGSACAFVSSFSSAPTVVSLRGSDWHVYYGSDLIQFGHSFLARALTVSRLAKFGKIIVMSNRMKDELAWRTSRQDIAVIPDAVDTTKFVRRERAEARRSLFGSVDVWPWVLFTSLDETNPIKRTSLARRAVDIAKISVPGLELRVATGIPHELMPQFVSSCDVVLCTSTHEGWPNSIKEGLACGLPFVSTDVSDLAEIAASTGSCLVAADHEEALASSLVKVLTRDKFDSAGLVAVAERMSIQQTCERIQSVYSALLTGK
jgi:glycosyltransferase involved in cell wall biosynthesis